MHQQKSLWRFSFSSFFVVDKYENNNMAYAFKPIICHHCKLIMFFWKQVCLLYHHKSMTMPTIAQSESVLCWLLLLALFIWYCVIVDMRSIRLFAIVRYTAVALHHHNNDDNTLLTWRRRRRRLSDVTLRTVAMWRKFLANLSLFRIPHIISFRAYTCTHKGRSNKKMIKRFMQIYSVFCI